MGFKYNFYLILATKSYLSNFSTRVVKESSKNFILIEEDNQENNIILQFGKIGDRSFSLDFTYPLSPLQAFAICLSSIENKFGSE